MFLFMFNFISAPAPVTTIFEGDYGINVEINIMPTYKLGEPRWSMIHLSNSTSGYELTPTTHENITCHIHLRNSQGFEVLDVEAQANSEYWYLNGSEGVNNTIGNYAWTVSCQDSVNLIGGYASGYFEITIDGEEQTNSKLLGNIILILLMIGLIGLVKYNHDHTDFDNWDSEIKSKHKNGHMGQTMVRSIVYNLFKNTFLWYYFLGWLIILILNNIVYGYLAPVMAEYFTLIANVYSVGFLLVTIFMIGHTYSYMKNTIDSLSDDNWGLGE